MRWHVSNLPTRQEKLNEVNATPVKLRRINERVTVNEVTAAGALRNSVDAHTVPIYFILHFLTLPSRLLIILSTITLNNTPINTLTNFQMGYPETAEGFMVEDQKNWQKFVKKEFKLKPFEDRDIDIAIDACGVCGSGEHSVLASP